jgi:hypothetical protein
MATVPYKSRYRAHCRVPMSHDSTLDFGAFITLPVCVLTSTLLIVSEPVHYQLVRYQLVRYQLVRY